MVSSAVKWVAGAVIAAILAEIVVRSYHVLRPHYTADELSRDADCRLVGGNQLVGSEDLVRGRHATLFIASGDLRTTFNKGSAAAVPGNIWIYNMRGDRGAAPVVAALAGFPVNTRFQPHGLYLSNASDSLYVVNHRGAESAVEIFAIEYEEACLSHVDWPCKQPVTLRYKRGVTSSLFPRYGINDVVEGTDDKELYVTRWQVISIPVRGMNNPESWVERLALVAAPLVQLFGLRLTQVFRCSWADGGEATCEDATGKMFYGANGITISKDRSTLYVNDPSDFRIAVMKRDPGTGLLGLESYIDLPFGADNIELDTESGEILMGTIPDFRLAIKNQFAEEGEVISPGGLGVASPPRGGGSSWTVHHRLLHDGSQLSQVSAGAELSQRIVLGSPFARGILVCHL